MGAIREMRRRCSLPDQYPLVPPLCDLPAQGDPVGFEAMMTGLAPEDCDLVLTGKLTSASVLSASHQVA